jgi:hypothetical protein
MVWSIGCTTTFPGREKFDKKIKEIMGKDNKHAFPKEGLCFDYLYVKDKKEWIIWT